MQLAFAFVISTLICLRQGFSTGVLRAPLLGCKTSSVIVFKCCLSAIWVAKIVLYAVLWVASYKCWEPLFKENIIELCNSFLCDIVVFNVTGLNGLKTDENKYSNRDCFLTNHHLFQMSKKKLSADETKNIDFQ